MSDLEFVKPKLKWKKKYIPFTTLTWSGTDTQASRIIEFELPWNPYDKKFEKWNIAKGDVIELWFEGSDHAWFVGTVTSREKTDQIGTVSFVAKDFMHHLLQSTGTYIFKNTTPEAIAKKVCGDVAVPVEKLHKTGVKIKKMIFESQCLYDIIIKAYRKVKSETKKNYLPVMLGKKVSVIEKGDACGVTLTQGVNITSATYSDNVDNMVDLVRIYNDKHKEVGIVKNDKNLKTYGVYQQAYQKESGVSAKKAAKSMLYGTNREASIEAFGDIRAMSGFSIKIKDPATGLTGTFFIVSDSHTFTNNTHIMQLDLAWKDSMEEGADTWKKQETTGGSSIPSGTYKLATQKVAQDYTRQAKPQTKVTYGYYIDYVGAYYHSSAGCSKLAKEKKSFKVKSFYSATVDKLKKMKSITYTPSGQQKKVPSHKPCPLCWTKGKYGELAAKETKPKGTLATTDPRYKQKPGIDTKKDPRYS